MIRLLIKNIHPKDTYYDMIGPCSQNINTSLFNSKYKLEVLCANSKSRRIFALTSYTFHISIPTLKLDMTTCTTCKCEPYKTILSSIQWPKLCKELKVPTLKAGSHGSRVLRSSLLELDPCNLRF